MRERLNERRNRSGVDTKWILGLICSSYIELVEGLTALLCDGVVTKSYSSSYMELVEGLTTGK